MIISVLLYCYVLGIFNDPDSNLFKWVILVITILTFAITIIPFVHNLIRYKWSRHDSFTNVELEGKKKYYVSNNYKEITRYIDNNTILKRKKALPKDSLDQFIEEVLSFEDLKSEQNICFVQAVTGTGKTTFLANLFLRYKKKANGFQKLFRTKPNVLLLKYNEITKEIVKGNGKSIVEQYEKKAKNTILLIDAMDEYVNARGTNGIDLYENYWENFYNDWEQLNIVIKKFKKVVITVRSQFLGNDSIRITNESRMFELELFDDSQSEKYIDLRFKESDGTRRQALKNLRGILKNKIDGADRVDDEEGYKIYNSPLVLNFLELMLDDKNLTIVRQTHKLTVYDIFSLIVNSWIKRQINNPNSPDFQNLKNFCKKLAYKIHSNSGQTLAENELKHFRGDMFHNLFKLDDRSLLKKQDIEERSVNGRLTLSTYYGFVHRSFLEFFLALDEVDEQEITDESDTLNSNRNIDFATYPLAQEFFISKRWMKVKTKLLDFEQIEGDYVSVETLTNWLLFFKKFTTNDSLKHILPIKFFHVVKKVEDHYVYFRGLKQIKIVNENFWNKERVFEDVICLIPYIKNEITWIQLIEAKNLKNDDLKIFEGIVSLQILTLVNNELDGAVLSYFSESRFNLKELLLFGNNIFDEHLVVFRGVNNLITLNLSFNKLNGSGLVNFSESRFSLKYLYLADNELTDRYLDSFEGSAKIKELDLSFNELDGSGLINFYKCRFNLEILNLSYNKITDKYLEVFRDSDKIQELNLDNNLLTKKGMEIIKLA